MFLGSDQDPVFLSDPNLKTRILVCLPEASLVDHDGGHRRVLHQQRVVLALVVVRLNQGEQIYRSRKSTVAAALALVRASSASRPPAL